MSEAVEVTEPRFLLMKRGLYWRPGSQGYTGIKEHAGRYLETEASPNSGVTAIHEDEAPEYTEAYRRDALAKHASEKVRDLSEQVEELREGLRKIDGQVSHAKMGDWRIALDEIRNTARALLAKHKETGA